MNPEGSPVVWRGSEAAALEALEGGFTALGVGDPVCGLAGGAAGGGRAEAGKAHGGVPAAAGGEDGLFACGRACKEYGGVRKPCQRQREGYAAKAESSGRLGESRRSRDVGLN